MSPMRLLLVAAALGGAVHFWHQHQTAVATTTLLASADENGFVDLPAAEGQRPDTVYIVAAVNCPHEAAQRADRLASALSAKGIPVIRTGNVSFSGPGVDASALKRLNVIMNGPLPIVFVHGRAKSAATLDDVQAELGARAGEST